MWITITKDRIKPTEFINEIHVDNTTNNISDILISLGESMKRVKNNDVEFKIPESGIEPKDVREWLRELGHNTYYDGFIPDDNSYKSVREQFDEYLSKKELL